MKTRIITMIWATIFSVPIVAKAQNSITGKVTNENGEAMPNAIIVIENTFLKTYSNAEGVYQFNNLKPDEYAVKVQFLGYQTQIKTIRLLTNQNLTVDFQLNPTTVFVNEVIISSTRANEKTPTTYTNLSKEEIEKANFGQDLPYLLQTTPSTVVTSDAGAGVGYTSVSIRGVDPSRTNVTINGIPVNDSESHGVYWVNMPDFASSVNSIQIQRGVGTSTNGAAAFGASINIETNDISDSAYVQLSNSYGSFNTWKNTVMLGTGKINDKFSMDARLSRISSDGYIDRANSNLNSFYVSGAWLGKKSNLKFNVFGGHEVTYQAWYGTPESVINGNVDELNAYADRNWLTDDQRTNLLNSGRTYNFYTYENEVDDYKQTHYQLHYSYKFNSKWQATLSGHYTRGMGFYEQYRENDRFSTYGLTPIEVDGEMVNRTDLIRRRWLDNHFYGGVYSVNYNPSNKLRIQIGGAANAYDGDHYGEIIWARFASQSEIRDRYYDNNALKIDANSFVKANYQLGKFNFFGDLQYRMIDYTFLGIEQVDDEIIDIEQNVQYQFFNPKAGLLFDLNSKNDFYASFSIANREPVRRDFRESTPDNRPLPEQLQNLEVGHRFKTKKFFLNTNVYWMNYKNQLILTGQINDVGGYTRTNVDKSYRAGVEIIAGYQLSKKFNIAFNSSFSQNKVAQFIEYVDDYDNWGQLEIIHNNTDIAFSPNFISSLTLNYMPVNNLQISLISKYVGAQYLDNTSNPNKQMGAYFISHGRINYAVKNIIGKELSFGFLVNNMFDFLYQNNGYTFSYIYGGETITENFYYPQAGRNFLGNITLKF